MPKISELTEVTSPNTSDYVPIVSGGETKKVTVANLTGGGGAKQPLDDTLTAVAGVTTAADKMIYFTGVDTAAATTVTSQARNLLDDTTASAMRSTLGVSGLLGIQIFTSSGTYTPTSGTASVFVEVQAGGGGGGGADATGAGQVSMGSGGASGAYSAGTLTSGFSGVTVTVGAAGAANLAANGSQGGTSSFGTAIVCAGGNGGQFVATQAPNILDAATAGGTVTTAGNVIACPGAAGNPALAIGVGANTVLGGTGGASLFGGGGIGVVGGNWGISASAYGAGGGGAANAQSNATQRTGGAGGAGIVIIWEYGA